ncbi:MAG: flagellar biosynthetic protein FliP [Candidatus Eremiobacter antarcticus]|nr:EscR/YscR/HrcR family type III secretion system export apparatus protein [Candidatus Eremiobacteraeota bacterium]MBC5807769.1 EscR/YscR/HrcR family type III secretion system export apparatus protein [Candidatus Eremiobacteraeota bacterium]PZR60612.1 MAG: flagellar biosynthetic protein FliP [Candidatus Eremiobacter sp. RRmetagenome_bin22]
MNDAAAFLSQPKIGSPVDLLIALFVLSLVPVLAVSVTSFTRIVVVLSLLRASLGTSSLPPNSVIMALSVMLTAAIMAPTATRIDQQAVRPYLAHRLSASASLQRAAEPLQRFMARQTRPSDVRAFARIARLQLSPAAQTPLTVLAPAFLVSELRTAFAMGFALALPFAVIDIVVAIVLMSLGMFMVSPGSISLPIKLLLFVVADGWSLVAGALAASFH